MTIQTSAIAASLSTGLLRDYRPTAGVADELFGKDGSIRPVWQNLIDHIAAMDERELANRMARADVYLRDSGVFYRQYDQADTAGERDWPLSHLPVLLAEDEWSGITSGLAERAEVLEKIVADIYGDNKLVRDGHLPAPLIAGNPEWLRPLVGVKPRSGNFLHFVAFDIGRSPHGKWWVLGDRTQAPSGVGFSLENRIATKKAFSEIYGASNVHRVAQFFSAFRDAMAGLRARPDSLVGLLTPGQFNDSYFEHAYIARYLGILLLEGEDLTVHKGQVMVRTIEGLEPIDVLWRRLDAGWTDPLELEEGSFIGTAGLVGAVRDGGVTMINALGTGILETKALQAFIPVIGDRLNGKPLALSNIATWWCGHDAERDFVKTHAERMIIGKAMSTGLPFDLDDEAAIAGGMINTGHATLANWIDAQAGALVGQEAVTLSTTPVLREGRLVPRPLSLRVYLARTAGGWQAMPGGFARIGSSSDFTKVALQRGGATADVWIVSDKPVDLQTLFGKSTAEFNAHNSIALTSRAADNLLWLGRYIERAENYVRYIRAYHHRLAESGLKETPLLARMAGFIVEIGVDEETQWASLIRQALRAAKASAGHVRDRFSTDGWLALDDLSRTADRFAASLLPGDHTTLAMSELLRRISSFTGLVHENMYRFTGWRFLSIGSSLERAMFIAQLLAAFSTPDSSESELELALEVADSTMSHRRQFGAMVSNRTVVEFLGLDPLNPRSILKQLNDINEHLAYLPGSDAHQRSSLQKSALAMQTALAIKSADTLDREAVLSLQSDLADFSGALTKAYLK